MAGIGCRGPVNEKKGEPALDLFSLRLTDLKDEPIAMKQFSGKTVFINFWATWCKPCRQEMPTISRMMQQLNRRDIVYLFASEESAGEILEFADQNDFKFQYVRLQNLADLDIMTLPTTFIFNNSGKLVFRESGYRDWNKPESIELVLAIIK